MPTRLMLRLVYVTSPPNAFSLVVPLRLAPLVPVPLVIAMRIELVYVATRLLPRSTTRTCGLGASVLPDGVLFGVDRNTKWCAGPTFTLKGWLTTDGRPLTVA